MSLLCWVREFYNITDFGNSKNKKKSRAKFYQSINLFLDEQEGLSPEWWRKLYSCEYHGPLSQRDGQLSQRRFGSRQERVVRIFMPLDLDDFMGPPYKFVWRRNSEFYVTEFKNVYFIWKKIIVIHHFWWPLFLIFTLKSRFLGALRSSLSACRSICSGIWHRGTSGDVSCQSKAPYCFPMSCARWLAACVRRFQNMWSMQSICFGPFVHFETLCCWTICLFDRCPGNCFKRAQNFPKLGGARVRINFSLDPKFGFELVVIEISWWLISRSIQNSMVNYLTLKLISKVKWTLTRFSS